MSSPNIDCVLLDGRAATAREEDLLAARRAGALGIGLQSGGYGREELERAGAYRVYADPAEMLARLDEVGVRFDEPGEY